MTSSEENLQRKKFSNSKTTEDIILGFQRLKNEQRYLSNRISEFDLDLQEHRIVINSLKKLDGERKCFRMIGGILCEKSVNDVISSLKANEENLVKLLESFKQQVSAKDVELIKYKEKFNLKVKLREEGSHLDFPESKAKENVSTKQRARNVAPTKVLKT